MQRKQRDVFAAVAQRGQVDLDCIDAEEQVFAEVSGRGFFVQLGVGRREHAHIDAAGLRGAHALQFAGFKHAQKLGLLAQRNVGDFVEEERAAVGEFEAPDAIGARIGKCAFDVAEDLAFEGAFGQSAGVDGNQRPCARAAMRREAAWRRFPCRCRVRR